MNNNNEIIQINGIEPPLHLESEPGKYVGFIINIKDIILTELNTEKSLEVIMPNKMEAQRLNDDLLNLKVNEEKEFIMRV